MNIIYKIFEIQAISLTQIFSFFLRSLYLHGDVVQGVCTDPCIPNEFLFLGFSLLLYFHIKRKEKKDLNSI